MLLHWLFRQERGR